MTSGLRIYFIIGSEMGMAFAMPLSGLLCESGFRSPPHQSKWPSVFYVFGWNMHVFFL